jgi:hypothetical protein
MDAVDSRESALANAATPAKTGVQDMQKNLDSRFRGNDGLESLACCGCPTQLNNYNGG